MKNKSRLDDKRILITGVAGTVGMALVETLKDSNAKSIAGLDNNEASLFEAEQSTNVEFSPILCDIRDRTSLEKSCRNTDIIFHLAALKHVPLCEKNPLEAIKSNILGVSNLIDAAAANDVEQVINTSTDKAVNPFNVMGASKLMGEQLVRAANLVSSDTTFSSIRFGNVLGSSGSVIPIFRKQIQAGHPITLTSREMTRFIMTLGEAVDLVIESAEMGGRGVTYVTKMHAIRVEMLAEIMIEELSNTKCHSTEEYRINEIGPRPGEKLFEELMSLEEARRSRELDRYYAILPALSDIYTNEAPANDALTSMHVAYNSATQKPLGKEQLRQYLKEHFIL